MGYDGWKSNEIGGETNSKTTENNDGSTTEHHLSYSDTKGDRENHNHVVINTNENGKITSAHSSGYKEHRDSYDSDSSGSGK